MNVLRYGIRKLIIKIKKYKLGIAQRSECNYRQRRPASGYSDDLEQNYCYYYFDIFKTNKVYLRYTSYVVLSSQNNELDNPIYLEFDQNDLFKVN